MAGWSVSGSEGTLQYGGGMCLEPSHSTRCKRLKSERMTAVSICQHGNTFCHSTTRTEGAAACTRHSLPAVMSSSVTSISSSGALASTGWASGGGGAGGAGSEADPAEETQTNVLATTGSQLLIFENQGGDVEMLYTESITVVVV